MEAVVAHSFAAVVLGCHDDAFAHAKHAYLGQIKSSNFVRIKYPVPRDHGTINSILFPGILGLFRHEDTPSIPFQNTTAQVPVREYRILPSIAGDQSTEFRVHLY
jgi:hypothetical protein